MRNYDSNSRFKFTSGLKLLPLSLVIGLVISIGAGDIYGFPAPHNPIIIFDMRPANSGNGAGIMATVNGYVSSQPDSPPVLANIAAKSVKEGELLEFNLSATDADSDSIIYTAFNLPAGASLSTDGHFSWRPDSGQAGTYNVTFLASDGIARDFQSVTISVQTNNGTPHIVLNPVANKQVNENELISFQLTATNIGSNHLQYTAHNLPTGASLAANGAFSWRPGYDAAGVYHITFTVSDGVTQDSKGIVITVNNVDRAPTIPAISDKTTKLGDTLSFPVDAYDPDGDNVSVTADNLPTGATFTNNTFSWTPQAGQSGQYSIGFVASDGRLQTSRSVNITIGATNSSPVLQSLNAQIIDENTLLSFPVTATDADGDTVTISASNMPTGATFSNGVFSWRPNYHQSGQYNVKFTASDGQAEDIKYVYIKVNNVNAKPVFDTIGPQVVEETHTLSFRVNATDADDSRISYRVDNLPTGAVFTNKQFTWTPTYQQAGKYKVTFTATDGKDYTPYDVLITVKNLDRPPVMANISDKVAAVKSMLSFQVTASDPDNDKLTYSVLNLPAGASFANNTFRWTPQEGLSGVYRVTFVVTDGTLSDSQTINITLTAPLAVDNTTPNVNNCIPAPGAIQAPLYPLLLFDITDSGRGVDASSVQVKMNGSIIYQGDTEKYTSDAGICQRLGVSSDYTFVFQPAKTWDYNQKVTISVKASDKAGNVMPDYSWYFMTEMYSFSQPQDLTVPNNPSDNQGQPATYADTKGNIYIVRAVGTTGSRNIILSRISAATNKVTANITLTNDTFDQCNPVVVCDRDNQIYAAWQGNNNGNWDIYLAHSQDGKYWTVPKQITTEQSDQRQPYLVSDPASPHRVYLLWQDKRNGNWDIYMAVSDSSFRSKQTAAVIQQPADQTKPAAVVSGDGTLYVCWNDNRNGNLDIYGGSYKNGSWEYSCLVNGTQNQFDPTVTIADNTGTNNGTNSIYLAWVDDSAGNRDIYYASFSAGSLPANPLTGTDIIDDTMNADQLAPQIKAALQDNGKIKVFLSWQDMRNSTLDTSANNSGGHYTVNSDSDIYFAELTGQSRTNILVNNSPDNTDQTNPAMGIDINGFPYLVWQDNSIGSSGDSSNTGGASSNISKICFNRLSAVDKRLAVKQIKAATGGTVGTIPQEINSLDEVCVQVPPGAFWSDVILTISKIDNPPSASFAMVNSPSYEFGPSSTLEFAKPVTITLPYNPNTSNISPTVYWYNPHTGTLSQSGISNVEDITLASGLHALQFRTTHFSQYMIGRRATISNQP